MFSKLLAKSFEMAGKSRKTILAQQTKTTVDFVLSAENIKFLHVY